MTPDQHETEALRLLGDARAQLGYTGGAQLVAAAHVHALLALRRNPGRLVKRGAQ